MTIAAPNSPVRLPRVEDADFDRAVDPFPRVTGAKTLLIALHPDARATLVAYLDRGRSALVGPSSAESGPTDDPGWFFVYTGAGEPRPLGLRAADALERAGFAGVR